MKSTVYTKYLIQKLVCFVVYSLLYVCVLLCEFAYQK